MDTSTDPDGVCCMGAALESSLAHGNGFTPSIGYTPCDACVTLSIHDVAVYRLRVNLGDALLPPR